MADNKMTVEEAVKLMEGNTSNLSDEQLAQATQAFSDNFFAHGQNDQKTSDAANFALGLAEERIQELAKQDTFDAADLDSIISMANNVSFFSSSNDIAKEVQAKAQAQKDELAAAAQQNQSTAENSADPITIDENTGDEQTLENQTQNDTEENTAQSQADEFTFGDESNTQETPENTNQLYEMNEETGEITYLDDEGNPLTEENQEEENVQDRADEEVLEAAENIPEEPELLDEFDKEYGIITTEEQANKHAEFMDNLEANGGFNPFALNEDGQLAHPEFQEEYNVFQNLEITDSKGQALSEEKQKDYKETLLKTAIFEAGMTTRGTDTGSDLETQYRTNLKSSLQKAVVSTVFASDAKKNMSQEELTAAFTKAATQEGGSKAKAKAVVSYAGVVHGAMNKIMKRMKGHVGDIPAVKKMDSGIKAFDNEMKAKYPQSWKIAKRVGKIVAKSAKNVAIYTAIGLVAGSNAPAAFMGLAIFNGAKTCMSINKQAKKNNQSFWQYAKTHKAEVALAFTTTGLSMAGAAIGVSTPALEGHVNPETMNKIRSGITWGVRALAVAPKLISATYHEIKAKRIEKGKAQKTVIGEDGKKHKVPYTEAEKLAAIRAEKEARNAALIGAVESSAGMALGGALGSYLQDKIAEYRQEQQEANNKANNTTEQKELNIAAPKGYGQDRDGDGIRDDIDPDHGDGWATANETQMNRLMDANPRAVNEVLGTNYTSAQLHQLYEHGSISDENLAKMHALATTQFDENGHIIDKDLKDLYTPKEAPARPEPLEKVEDIAPIKVEPIKLDLNVKVDIPEHLEVPVQEEVRDEQYYKKEDESLNPTGEDSLKDKAQEALKDPNKTVDETIEQHFDDQVAKGNLSEQQGEEMTTVTKGNVGTLYGETDDELTKRDINNGIKQTENAVKAAKDHAEEVMLAENIGKNIDASGEGNFVHRHQDEHSQGYSQDTKSSAYYKGLEEYAKDLQKASSTGDMRTFQAVTHDIMRSGGLSEEQIVEATKRIEELQSKGYRGSDIFKQLGKEYHDLGNHYWNHIEYAAEHQNENAHTVDNTNTDANSGTTPQTATKDGATATTPTPQTATKDGATATTPTPQRTAAELGTVDMSRQHSADSLTEDSSLNRAQRLAQLSGRSTPPPVAPELSGSSDHIPSKEEVMGNTLSLNQIKNGGRS